MENESNQLVDESLLFKINLAVNYQNTTVNDHNKNVKRNWLWVDCWHIDFLNFGINKKIYWFF